MPPTQEGTHQRCRIAESRSPKQGWVRPCPHSFRRTCAGKDGLYDVMGGRETELRSWGRLILGRAELTSQIVGVVEKIRSFIVREGGRVSVVKKIVVTLAIVHCYCSSESSPVSL